MKRFYLTLSALLLIAVSLLPLACSYPPSYPPNYGGPPTVTPTPTATLPPVILSVNSSFRYSTGGTTGPSLSAPITISVGQGVVWDSSVTGHPLYIDNMNSTCDLNNNQSFPVTYYFTAAGSYLAHCGIHGQCTVLTACPASNCTGMAATITAQ